jgi:hypothetical protein
LKVFLYFAYFGIVSTQVILGAISILVDLIDNYCQITVDEESLDSKGDSYPEPMDESFVLCFIVCGLP